MEIALHTDLGGSTSETVGIKRKKKIVIDKKGENHLTLFHRPGTRIKTSRNQHFPNATVLVFTFPFFLIGVKSDRSTKKLNNSIRVGIGVRA